MSESFFDTPFVDDVLNNQKPEKYPQKFHYYGAETLPQHARNKAAMVVHGSAETMTLMNQIKK